MISIPNNVIAIVIRTNGFEVSGMNDVCVESIGYAPDTGPETRVVIEETSAMRTP